MFHVKHYDHNYIGKLGENLAVRYLSQKGYKIIEKNYYCKYGELDIVSRETSGKLIIFEVKSVSRETNGANNKNVSRETFDPAYNMHNKKFERLLKTTMHYVNTRKLKEKFSLKLITVEISKHKKHAKFKIFDLI